MKICVIAIGRLKEKFWISACDEYLKRLQPYAKVTVKELPDVDKAKAGSLDAALEKEAQTILNALPPRSHVILLAIEGKQYSSEELSTRLDALALSGASDISIIIGGSDGVHTSIKQRADEAISFGRITLPHNLARVVLLEQVYRAFKISRGEPYHK